MKCEATQILVIYRIQMRREVSSLIFGKETKHEIMSKVSLFQCMSNISQFQV